jgi:hypothetical protein
MTQPTPKPTPLAALLLEIARRRRIRAQYERPRAEQIPETVRPGNVGVRA